MKVFLTKGQLAKAFGKRIVGPLVISKKPKIWGDTSPGYELLIRQGKALWKLDPQLRWPLSSRYDALQYAAKLCAKMKKEGLVWDFGKMIKKEG